MQQHTKIGTRRKNTMWKFHIIHLKKVCSLISIFNDEVDIPTVCVCVSQLIPVKNKFPHVAIAKNED